MKMQSSTDKAGFSFGKFFAQLGFAGCWVVGASIGLAQQAGDLDRSFLETQGGAQSGDSVNAVSVAPNGEIVVGGNFYQFANQSHMNMVRLDPSGVVDASFSGNC
jgi:hypothetical protein